MKRTDIILIMTLFLLFSCKHEETNSERYKRNIKANVELLTKKVDSYTRTTGIRKTIFVIDTTDIKFKNLVSLDIETANRIRNAKMIMEDEFTSKIDTFETELYFFANLTNTFKDTTYIILEKENIVFPNLRLYLVKIKNDKTLIKLLAADENQSCMSTITTSALIGDSIIYTLEKLDAFSDIIESNRKSYFIKTEKIKKYILKNNLYSLLDSIRTTGYE